MSYMLRNEAMYVHTGWPIKMEWHTSNIMR